MTKIIKIKGLDCAHCASKIEKEVKKIAGVEKVNLNFLTQKLTIDAPEDNINSIMEDIIKVCNKIEPDCEVIL